MKGFVYSPSAYYIASLFTNTLIYLFQPLIYATISYNFLGFNLPDVTQEFEGIHPTYYKWLKILLAQALLGSAFGFMFACLFSNNFIALVLIHMGILVPYFSAGVFANISSSSSSRYQLVRFFSKISPFKYACEAMLRTMLEGFGEEYVD